jgi:hypothetical protein
MEAQFVPMHPSFQGVPLGGAEEGTPQHREGAAQDRIRSVREGRKEMEKEEVKERD